MSDNAARPSPEQIMAQFAQIKAEAEATVQKYEDLSAEFGVDAVEVHSEDGLLRVKLDANGQVEEIGVNEAAMRFRQSLGPSMVGLIATAREEYALKTTEMARRMIGDKLDVDAILNQFRPPR